MLIPAHEIAQKLEILLDELSSTENLVNPFFRISKGIPEQISKYSFLNNKFLRTTTLLQFFIGVFTGIFMLILMVTCSLIFARQYKIFKLQNRSSQIIFVSHGIGQNITQNEGDQFFWKIPEYLQNEGKKVSIIYTNHNLINYKKNSKLIQSKSSEIERFLVPKFLKPTENLEYLNKVTSLASKSLFLAVKKIKHDPIGFALLLKCTVFFFKRGTYSNYLLKKRIQNTISVHEIEKVILTFEGHSYEQYIIEELLNIVPNLKIFLYQHSPIVKDHFGIVSFLQKFNKKLFIFTTGKYYAEFFNQITKLHCIEVLGSNKFDSNSVKPVHRDKLQLLFVPEGTAYATKNMLNLISTLIKTDIDFQCILRLHPNLKSNLKVSWLIKQLKTKKKFELSNNLLNDDLAIANYVVYRSSAVGIESLKSTAIPIFYGAHGYSGINVLAHVDNIFPTLFSEKDAIQFFRSNSNFLKNYDAKEVYCQLFERINYIKIKNYLVLS